MINKLCYINPTACLCNPEGSRSEVCDRVSGQCKCRHDNITGRTCSNCTRDGYYGPVKGRCRECKCIPANTMECHKVSTVVEYHVIMTFVLQRTGKCRCRSGWTGETCNEGQSSLSMHIHALEGAVVLIVTKTRAGLEI